MKLAAFLGLALFAQDPISTPAPRPVELDRPNELTPAPVEGATPTAGQEPPPVQRPEDAPVVSRPDAAAPAPAWDGAAPKDAAELGELLLRFSTAWPHSFRARELGRSRTGAAVWLGTVTRSPAEDEARVPTLLSVPPPHATRDALARSLSACVGLLDRAESDAALAERLSACAVQFLFAPDPEHVFGAEVRAPVFDYPVDWTSGGGRPHPLFEPETRVMAAFLARLPTVGVCTFESAEPGRPLAFGAEAEALVPGGTLARFVRGYLGASVAIHPRATDATAERSAAALALVELLALLPRLVSAEPVLERVRSDHWIVELEIRNDGRAGTLEAAAAERERSSVWAELAGSELAAVARASSAPNAVFEPVNARANAFELGHLAGGETVRLRLVVRGAEGASAKLVLRSLRAGGLDVAIALK